MSRIMWGGGEKIENVKGGDLLDALGMNGRIV
jgi:hypothetical protein